MTVSATVEDGLSTAWREPVSKVNSVNSLKKSTYQRYSEQSCAFYVFIIHRKIVMQHLCAACQVQQTS